MQLSRSILIWFLIGALMIFAFNMLGSRQMVDNKISFTEFVEMVNDGKVEKATIKGEEIVAITKDGKKVETVIPEGYSKIYDILQENGVKIHVVPAEKTGWLTTLLISWLPILLFIGLWIFMMRQMSGGSNRAFSFAKSKAKVYLEEKPNVKLDDVAGMDEVKEEVKEIIDYLKDPQRFQKLGGRAPKGILFYGDPGVGKTLLAKAIAGEANVPFISISGSDFVEMFVGVGAARVRDLFETAKKHAPCLVFIDEIDAVGRARSGVGFGGGHDEREQTLNQLLVELDGFESGEGIIVIAATNRPDILDPALLRPGRFDRQISVPKPDVKGRYEILKVHVKKKNIPLDQDVDLMVIARGTPGFSGADLANIVNEAALLAARKRKEKVGMKEFEEAMDRIMMGLERKGMAITPAEKEKIAYHEVGHAIVSLMFKEADPLHKVSIIPRGMALGVTVNLPEEDRHIYSKKDLIARIHQLFGGRAAEEVFYGKDGITTGAENDLMRATELAYRIVASWGMTDELGPIHVSTARNNPFMPQQGPEISEETARKIDEEVNKLLREAYQRTKEIIESYKDAITAVVELLLDKETISCEEMVAILEEYGVPVINKCRKSIVEVVTDSSAPDAPAGAIE
ncbi:cell division protease FtsH [Persephonella hydrogeniphila]|uniref:ATP-dependent zinc metalloprotease FtsH n=1 Tax=Persephonella hydrogeniphila TaxID=198703 RepID=A0A285NET6_9AQUI|nr:ATP-dependent zinc metalloprotease FtsH [Persephonella hydrogeniphila]SNZ07788.1 cell division protease FtsH [Persephonella hydrogeniphila]